MKLSRKTFLYSIGISTLLIGLIVIYFVTMLPSLYVDYRKKENLKSVVEVEKGYMKNRSYDGLTIQNPTGSATLEIPVSGEEVYVAGKGFQAVITVRDEKLKKFLTQIRDCFQDMEHLDKEKFEKIDWDLLKEGLGQTSVLNEKAPVDVDVEVDSDAGQFQEDGDGKVHVMKDDIYVFEGGVADETNQYTTYIAMGKSEGSLVFSFLPVMTPQMKEIKPIVLGSVPMISAVLFLIVMICSQYFSRKIVNPVIRLSRYAQEIRSAGNLDVAPFEIREKDEIGELGRSLNELYDRLKENYEKLEEKNERLKQENKRQEVFLRASSHQLKTPVTAALLLIDGMIQEVGKYKDTKTYLPQVKEQLQAMRKIVEDILYLNHCTEHLELEPVEMNALVEETASAYAVQMDAKQLKLEKTERPCRVVSDRELLKKILDNLFSNAVSYTPAGSRIFMEVGEKDVRIFNEGAYIEESLLPHVYEPFVSGSSREKGKGLGLYVAAYYCEVLGHQLTIENVQGDVQRSLPGKAPHDLQRDPGRKSGGVLAVLHL